MDRTIVAAALAVEERTGVAAAVLLAIAQVESAGRPFAMVESRREPLIRFEGHWFDRLLSEAGRIEARKAGLASPKAGAVRNPASQAARWRLLGKAAAIDADAAYAATSWGLGQVMGLHWKRIGFASASALAEEARRSAEGQLLLVARFLKQGDLDRRLAQRRFAEFARAYNGPGFRANRYDAKIATAFDEAARMLAEFSASAPASQSLSSDLAHAPGNEKSRPLGWAGLVGRLFAGLQWISPHTSIPVGMRSFSTSTERLSGSPTTPPGSR